MGARRCKPLAELPRVHLVILASPWWVGCSTTSLIFQCLFIGTSRWFATVRILCIQCIILEHAPLVDTCITRTQKPRAVCRSCACLTRVIGYIVAFSFLALWRQK